MAKLGLDTPREVVLASMISTMMLECTCPEEISEAAWLDSPLLVIMGNISLGMGGLNHWARVDESRYHLTEVMYEQTKIVVST